MMQGYSEDFDGDGATVVAPVVALFLCVMGTRSISSQPSYLFNSLIRKIIQTPHF